MFGNKTYHFAHLIDGRETRNLRGEELEKGNDPLAEYMALIHARRLWHDGVSQGDVVATGPNDFRYSVAVATAAGAEHPFDKLSTTEMDGSKEVFDTIFDLWPYEGEQPVKKNKLGFRVWGDTISVEISNPKGAAMDLVYNGVKISAGLRGPSEYTLVIQWGVTKQEAEAIWKEVCAAMKVLRAAYLS